VFSREAVAPPDASCGVDEATDGSLNCHGYGSMVTVTASFGLCAAGWVINTVAENLRSSSLSAFRIAEKDAII
jgi:tRNA A37 threonylcarbamoyladenosine dehydratase